LPTIFPSGVLVGWPHDERVTVFRLDQNEGPDKYRLIDEDRRVTFRTAGGIVQSSARTALLSWDGREIPLEFDDTQRTDPATGETHNIYQFNTFGESWEVTERLGVGMYTFQSPQERAQALLLAAEAVLVNHYKFVKGDWRLGFTRVAAEGREWLPSDFGYRTSSDITDGPH
jgi:hypothetical protein